MRRVLAPAGPAGPGAETAGHGRPTATRDRGRAPARFRALALFCLLALPASALAQTGGESGASAEATAEVEERAITEGDLTNPVVIAALFRSALADLERGDGAAAIPKLRAILAKNPRLVRVRLELARALFADRRFDESREEFFSVLSGGVPDQVRRRVLRFIRAIDGRSGFDWSFAAGLRFNPGSTRNYRSDTVVVDPSGTGERVPLRLRREDPPPVQLEVEAGAEFRRALGAIGDVRVVGFAEGEVDLLKGTTTEGDETEVTLRSGARFVWPRTTLTLAPEASLQMLDADHYEDRFGAGATVEHRTGAGWAVAVTASGLRAVNREDARLDGTVYTGGVSVARSFGGRARAGVTILGERRLAQTTGQSYRLGGVQIFGAVDVAGGFSLSGSVFAIHRRYDGIASILVEERRDTEIGADLKVVKNDLFLLGRFSPFVEIGASRQLSTIDAFAYDELRFGIGFERAL